MVSLSTGSWSKVLMALNGLQSAKHKVSLRPIKSLALQVLGRKPKSESVGAI